MNSPTATATAFSYIRFSRISQKQGRSRDRQMEDCVKWCNEKGLTLSEDTFLDEGKSGYTGDHVGPRGQLRRFLDLVEAGKIPQGSYLVVESLDRLGRESVNEALGRFIGILNAGVNIVTLMDGARIYTKNFTLEDVLTSVVVMSRANEESRTKAGRSRDNWKTAFERARTEKKPVGKQVALWLELVENEDKTKEYRERPERVAIVKRLFRQCIAGHGFVAIAKSLNSDSIPAFRGGTWCPSSVKDILDNKCVLGEWNPQDGGPVIEGYFPTVIEPETWELARSAMSKRRKGDYTRQTPNFQVWQQIASCAVCGSSMNLVTKGALPQRYKYLTCSNKRKGLCAPAESVRAEKAEQVFKELLVKVGALGLIQTEAAAITDAMAAVDASIHNQETIRAGHMKKLAENAEMDFLYELVHTADQHIKRLKAEREELEAKHSAQTAAQSDKAWLMANLPLTERDDRQRANALLCRLGVTVRIQGGKSPLYMCSQKGKDFLQIMTNGDDIVIVPRNAEQRAKFKEQDVDGSDLAKGMQWLSEKIGPKKAAA